MILTCSSLFWALVSLTAQTTLAASIVKRDSSFSLLAYGSTGIGGFPLLEKDGFAYAVQPEVSQAHPEYLSVNFTMDTSNSTTWIATPTNSSLSCNATLKLGIDTDANADGAVGFTADSNSSWSTTGWVLYGNTVLHETCSSSLQSKFFANNNTGIEGVWAITWDTEDSTTEGYPIALRKVAQHLSSS